MRRVLLIFSVLLCGVCSAQKQSSNRHVSLADCGNDTLQYIRVNFIQNKERYIGLPMDSLFKALDIPIKDFGALASGYKTNIDGMIIVHIEGREREKYKKMKKSYYVINVMFKEPHTVNFDEWGKLSANGGIYWKEWYYNFFKDFIISDFLIFDGGKGKGVK